MKYPLVLLFTLAAAALLAACEPALGPAKNLQYSHAPAGHDLPIYRFAVHPLHNPQKLSESYQPLVEYLNRHVQGAHIELEASRNYQDYEQKFRDREPAFLLPNPWQTLQAIEAGYHVIAMAGDTDDFRGVFIVRRNSDIKTPADLKGKVVSYPSHTALAAAIMPQYYLHTHGIDIRRDIRNHYVGSQESSIINVYLGQSDAGATWLPPWRLFQTDHPAEAAQLKLIWTTPPLPNNSVMVRDDVPVAVREQVGKALIELGRVPEGRAILGRMETARFHPADNASYEPVRDYISRFERDVRPVERP